MIIIVVVVVIVGIVCKVTQGCSKLHSTLCKKKVDNLNVFYLNVWVFFFFTTGVGEQIAMAAPYKP